MFAVILLINPICSAVLKQYLDLALKLDILCPSRGTYTTYCMRAITLHQSAPVNLVIIKKHGDMTTEFG